MHDTKLLKYWPVLGYWLVCGALAALIVNYSYDNGSTYIKLYSHFFMFPLFFGWIGVLLIMLSLPFVNALLNKWNRVPHFWFGIAIFCFGALFVELSSENIAPWEVSPAIVDGNRMLSDHFESENHSKDVKDSYQKLLNSSISEINNWSLFRWLYPISFFIQLYSLLAILFVVFLLAAYRRSSIFVDGVEFRKALAYSSSAIVVSLLYSLMRIAYSYQKTKYYPEESIPGSDYVILGLFVVGLLLATACYWAWLGEKLSGVITFVFGGTGLIAGWGYKHQLRELFGKDASYLNYILILLAVLLLGYMWFFFRPPTEREKS